MEWKDKGNAFFKAGNNSSAIQCYTKGLQGVKDGVMVDTSLIKVLYSNRSAAYVRYGKPEEALKDAEEALKLDPHWGKAYGRKGKALFDLAKYDLALETYEEGLAVDKMNGTLRAGIEECREAKKKAEEEDPLAAFMDDISALDASASGKAEEKTESKGEGEEEGADGKGGVDEKKQKYNVDHDAETRGWTKENQLKRLLQHQHKWLNLNPYFAFGLDPSANIDDIKRRYKKLNLLVHPDKNRDPLAEDAFQQVRVAYHKLKDPGERESALTLIKQTTDRVRKTRKRLLKKKGVTEDDLIAKDGTLEDAIAKEIKKEFATRERKRLKSMAHRRDFNNREMEKKREEAQYWKEVKETEMYMRETRDQRVGKWVDFTKKKKRKNAALASKVELEANKRRAQELKGHKGVGLDESYKASWR